MTESEWRRLLQGPSVPKLILTSPREIPSIHPVLLDRDGDDLVFVTWRESEIARGLRRNPMASFVVDFGEHVECYHGKASLHREDGAWNERIWKRHHGDLAKVRSDDRADTLVRVTEIFAAPAQIPEPIEHQLYIYPGEDPTTILKKLVFSINRHMRFRAKEATLITLDTPIQITALVRGKDIERDRLQQPVALDKRKLVALQECDKLLKEAFRDCGGWFNISVFMERETARLISLDARGAARPELPTFLMISLRENQTPRIYQGEGD